MGSDELFVKHGLEEDELMSAARHFRLFEDQDVLNTLENFN